MCFWFYQTQSLFLTVRGVFRTTLPPPHPSTGDWATHGVSSLWHRVMLPLTTSSVILGLPGLPRPSGPAVGRHFQSTAWELWPWTQQAEFGTHRINLWQDSWVWWVSLGSDHPSLPSGLVGRDPSQKLFRWTRAEQRHLWTGLGDENQAEGWVWRGTAQGAAISWEKPGYVQGREGHWLHCSLE